MFKNKYELILFRGRKTILPPDSGAQGGAATLAVVVARPLVVPATVVRCAKDPDHPGRVVDERREEGVACENASFQTEFGTFSSCRGEQAALLKMLFQRR